MNHTISTDSIQVERDGPIEAVPSQFDDDRQLDFADNSSSVSAADAISLTPAPVSGASKKVPSCVDRSVFVDFRRICNTLKHEIIVAKQHLSEGLVDEFGLPAILHIEDLLEELFDCEWGQGEHLKRVVVAIESQTKNVEWTSSHVAFLEEVIGFLSTRYVIDEFVVSQCVVSIKSHGLDPFRGTVAEPETLRKYKIVESNDD